MLVAKGAGVGKKVENEGGDALPSGEPGDPAGKTVTDQVKGREGTTTLQECRLSGPSVTRRNDAANAAIGGLVAEKTREATEGKKKKLRGGPGLVFVGEVVGRGRPLYTGGVREKRKRRAVGFSSTGTWGDDSIQQGK